LEQVFGHVALVDGGGHDAPGPDDPAAQVGPDRHPEAMEPFAVRGVAAEAGDQVVTRAGPAVGAADPGGVLDRQRGGIDLPAVIFRQPGRQHGPQLLEGSPQPADPPVRLTLAGQAREQVRPVPGHLGQEPGSLRRPSRCRTSATASSSASVHAGAGPGRGAMATAPELIASSTST
jgi:hypothetical protein